MHFNSDKNKCIIRNKNNNFQFWKSFIFLNSPWNLVDEIDNRVCAAHSTWKQLRKSSSVKPIRKKFKLCKDQTKFQLLTKEKFLLNLSSAKLCLAESKGWRWFSMPIQIYSLQVFYFSFMFQKNHTKLWSAHFSIPADELDRLKHMKKYVYYSTAKIEQLFVNKKK